MPWESYQNQIVRMSYQEREPSIHVITHHRIDQPMKSASGKGKKKMTEPQLQIPCPHMYERSVTRLAILPTVERFNRLPSPRPRSPNLNVPTDSPSSPPPNPRWINWLESWHTTTSTSTASAASTATTTHYPCRQRRLHHIHTAPTHATRRRDGNNHRRWGVRIS